MLIGRQRNLLLAISGPSPRPPHRDTPATERDLTSLVAMTNRRAIGVVLALRAHDIIDLLLHQLAQDAEPNTNAERQQPLLRCPHEMPQSLLNTLRQNDLIHGRPSDRYVVPHGGSSFDLGRITANAPNRNGRGGGTAVLQSSTSYGTTSAFLLWFLVIHGPGTSIIVRGEGS
jgi:hypothetical protein